MFYVVRESELLFWVDAYPGRKDYDSGRDCVGSLGPFPSTQAAESNCAEMSTIVNSEVERCQREMADWDWRRNAYRPGLG